MTSPVTSPHTYDREPFWTVMAIHDHDGGGGDFSYTVGLHDKGMPELWLAARPSLGHDPGFDWKLSQRDTCDLLNEFSWRWLAGGLRVGDQFEEAFDGGLVTVRFQVDPAADRDILEALRIHPEATVVPVRWSLHRPDAGANEPMSAEMIAPAEERFGFLRSIARPSGSAPATHWELPDGPSWNVDQRYGPRTPLIQALAALYWTSDAERLTGLIQATHAVNRVRPWLWPLAIARTAALAAGRGEALRQLDADIDDLVERHHKEVEADLIVEIAAIVGNGERVCKEQLRVWKHLSCELLRVTLGVELVADLVPSEVRLHALGLLVAGCAPVGEPTPVEWLASDRVRAEVDRILDKVGPWQLFDVCRIHAECSDPRYLRIVDRLDVETLTTAACWRPLESLTPSFYLSVAIARAEAGWNGSVPLNDWANKVSAILTHRAQLTAEEVETFTRPYAEVLPQLEEWLNAPL